MPAGQRPEAIDTRLVFRTYAWTAVALGAVAFAVIQFVKFDESPWGPTAMLAIAGALVWAFASYAAALAHVDDPVGRHRGLKEFAIGHLLVGLFLFTAWKEAHWGANVLVVAANVPAIVWGPFVFGAILLYLAYTATPASRFTMTVRSVWTGPGGHQRMMALRDKSPSIRLLRSQYEEQIRQAARQEERARLARDLHDAVKQQLFVIQTAAATVEARFDTDEAGAKAALQQVRGATREAMIEMEAMLERIQATPIENVGLIEAMKKQCEALGFQTGAAVTFDHDRLPPADLVPPGTQLAVFRFVQEALANVGRHARASHVSVRLFSRKRRLVLEVADDGAGFDPMAASGGMGIANMRTRAAEVGGQFTLTSSPGAGTTLNISVPYQAASPWTYGILASASALVLAWLGVLLVRDGPTVQPWRIAVVSIAAIALARYAVALYRVRRMSEAAV